MMADSMTAAFWVINFVFYVSVFNYFVLFCIYEKSVGDNFNDDCVSDPKIENLPTPVHESSNFWFYNESINLIDFSGLNSGTFSNKSDLSNTSLPLVSGNCFEFLGKGDCFSNYYSTVISFLGILESYSFRINLVFHSKVVKVIRNVDNLYEFYYNELVCSEFDNIAENNLLSCFSQNVSSIVGVLLHDMNLHINGNSSSIRWDHKLFIVRFSNIWNFFSKNHFRKLRNQLVYGLH